MWHGGACAALGDVILSEAMLINNLRMILWARINPAVSLRSIRKADKVAAEVVAATVANLKLVRPGSTRIIVMDRGDGQAIDVAKALETVGCRRAYVLRGGFRRVSLWPPLTASRVNDDRLWQLQCGHCDAVHAGSGNLQDFPWRR